VSEQADTLLRVTREALELGIAQAAPGNRIGDISNAIQQHVEKHGLSVVRSLVGHGIGRRMHEEPQVPNYGPPHRGPRLMAGQVLAIEPMVNAGAPEVVTKPDGWTVVTQDGSLSAHFEHTVAVGPRGPEILCGPATADAVTG
jgi:methionyl aminopeptidase